MEGVLFGGLLILGIDIARGCSVILLGIVSAFIE